MSENGLLTTVPAPDGFWDDVEPTLIRALFLEAAERFCEPGAAPIWMTRMTPHAGRLDYLLHPSSLLGFKYQPAYPLDHSASAVSYYQEHVARELSSGSRLYLGATGRLMLHGTDPLNPWDPFQGLLD